MKIKDIINTCNKAIPREVEYSKGEMYGAVNIPDENADVTKILYCVTPSDEVAEHFHKNNYDLVISHHPITFKDKTIPHAVYHTALDCCEGGLNDMWADALKLKKDTMKHFDDELGWFGELETPVKFNELVSNVEKFAGSVDGQVYCKGNKLIKTVVICSGLGGLVTEIAAKTGADCYILGEATDNADMMGFDSVIETGHTNSEWQGVNFFKDLLEQHGLTVDSTPLELDKYGEEHFIGNEEQYAKLDAVDQDVLGWWPEDSDEYADPEDLVYMYGDKKTKTKSTKTKYEEWSEVEIEEYYESLEHEDYMDRY